MVKVKDKLWYIDNKTGKISTIIVEKVHKTDFSFRSKGTTYRADFSTIGTKYYFSQQELLDKQMKRAFKRSVS